MADEVSDGIEDALSMIVSTTEQSGNMRKGLKQIIFETVSTLRNPFVKLKDSRDSKSIEISQLEMQVTEKKTKLGECSGKNAMEHGSPSVIYNHEPTGTTARRMALPGGREGKLYSEAVGGEKNLRRFKLSVQTKRNHPPETIKDLLKTKINPTDIKGGGD
jgi:hypothetical protein